MFGSKFEKKNQCNLLVFRGGKLDISKLASSQINVLWCTQRAMERMLGLSLRGRVRNEEIRRLTKVSDIIERVAHLKWQWIGNAAKQDLSGWAYRILKWRSVGRPQKR